MPSFATSVSIFDITGRMVGKAVPVVSGLKVEVVWPGISSEGSGRFSGKYFATVSAGGRYTVMPFILAR